MRMRSIVAASLVLVTAGRAWPAALPETDRLRLAESFRLADGIGTALWPGWDAAPFAVLLVTPDHEFLLRHPDPSPDFERMGEDAMLGTTVWSRPRRFPTGLLATFPAVGGISTIVIGQAENTEAKTSTRWVITMLHEHFHQLQDSQPDFHRDVNALGLARDDSTGMWMLNYPFPYDDPAVGKQFTAMAAALGEALRARGTPAFGARLESYVAARAAFRDMLAPDDYRYWCFQVWKEGIARYTEFRLATMAADGYQPGAAFTALADHRTYRDVADGILGRMEEELASVQLAQRRREVVYNFGAAEGLVLDAASPGWRERYFTDRFTLEPYFKALERSR